MIGKWILIFGVVLVVVGAAWPIGSLGLPLGGIQMRGKGWFFSFLTMTSIVVSVLRTELLDWLIWLLRWR